MTICIPKEIMNHEHRVAMVPGDIGRLKQSNQEHKIYIEDGLGSSIGFSNECYEKVGALVIKEAKRLWEEADLIVKCKEPLESEYPYLREDLILYSFLDLAYSKSLATALVDSKVTAICAESIAGAASDYPVLRAMSEITGKFAGQHAATLLALNYGGRGVLVGGCLGVAPSKAVIVGGGEVGMNAALALVGLGAEVWVLERQLNKLARHPLVLSNQIRLLYSDESSLQQALKGADILIGAVLVTGNATPKVVTREHLRLMNRGGVVLDVSVDLGGCIETARQTSHDNPTYIEEGLVHYGVPNIPGVIARTSSITYSHESIPYVLCIANHGWREMLKMPGALGGLNAHGGKIATQSVAKAFNLPYIDAASLL